MEIEGNMEFGPDEIKISGEETKGTWKKDELQIDQYQTKNMQSQFYEGLKEESHGCLGCNLGPKKVSAIFNMQEQMIETRGQKKTRGINILSENCRRCIAQKETVMHFFIGM